MQLQNTSIGKIIKNTREYLGFNQLDICQGICTQSQFSKIESGISIPSSYTLYLISRRLGLDIGVLFESTYTERYDYIINFKKTVRFIVSSEKYTVLYGLIKAEEDNPSMKNNEYNQQFIMWHKGICLFYHLNKPSKSLVKLYKALKLTHHSLNRLSPQEAEILNSIGGIHLESGDYNEAVFTFQDILCTIKNFPISQFPSFVFIKVKYNLSKAFSNLRQYEKSNSMCEKAVQICIENESFYLLSELYYQLGYNHYISKQYKKSMDYLDKSIYICKVTRKPYESIKRLKDLIKNYMKEKEPLNCKSLIYNKPIY